MLDILPVQNSVSAISSCCPRFCQSLVNKTNWGGLIVAILRLLFKLGRIYKEKRDDFIHTRQTNQLTGRHSTQIRLCALDSRAIIYGQLMRLRVSLLASALLVTLSCRPLHQATGQRFYPPCDAPSSSQSGVPKCEAIYPSTVRWRGGEKVIMALSNINIPW